MALLTNNAEGGTSGTTVTTANSGAPSGNAWDTVTIGTTGTLAYDSTHTAHGGLSYKFQFGGTAADVLAQWDTTLGSGIAQLWFRVYAYFTANPGVATPLWSCSPASGLSARLFVNTAGKLIFNNSAGSTILTSTATVPLNAFFRVEGFCVGSATVGQLEFKLFTAMDSLAPAETQTSSAAQNTSGTMAKASFGNSGTTIANVGPFWLDDVGVSTTGYLGPSVAPAAAYATSLPPGFLSPAAWPFIPSAFPDDAPPVTPQPYYVASGAATGTGTTVTIGVQNPTARGDAIVVAATSSNAGGLPVSCTDSQGNIYSQVAAQAATKVSALYVAQNTIPLGTSDTITATSASANTTRAAVALGVPATAVVTSPGGSFLTYDLANAAGTGAPFVSAATPAGKGIAGIPEMVIAAAVDGTANTGGPQYGQGWTVPRPFQATSGSGDYVTVAYKPLSRITAGSTVVAVTQPTSGNMAVLYVTLRLEDRFAPSRYPDMPPGNLSPGAWQFQPLPRGGAVTGTASLASQAVASAAVTRQPQATGAATVTTTGSVTRRAAVTLSGAAAASAVLARQLARSLAGAATTAAGLARQPARTVADAVTASGTLGLLPARVLAATVATSGFLGRALAASYTAAAAASGAVSRQTGRAFTATVTAGVALARQCGRPLASAVAAGGALARQAAVTLAAATATAGTLARAVMRQLSTAVAATATALIGRAYLRAFAAAVAAAAAAVLLAHRPVRAAVRAAAPVLSWAARTPLVRWITGAPGGDWDSPDD